MEKEKLHFDVNEHKYEEVKTYVSDYWFSDKRLLRTLDNCGLGSICYNGLKMPKRFASEPVIIVSMSIFRIVKLAYSSIPSYLDKYGDVEKAFGLYSEEMKYVLACMRQVTSLSYEHLIDKICGETQEFYELFDNSRKSMSTTQLDHAFEELCDIAYYVTLRTIKEKEQDSKFILRKWKVLYLFEEVCNKLKEFINIYCSAYNYVFNEFFSFETSQDLALLYVRKLTTKLIIRSMQNVKANVIHSSGFINICKDLNIKYLNEYTLRRHFMAQFEKVFDINNKEDKDNDN